MIKLVSLESQQPADQQQAAIANMRAAGATGIPLGLVMVQDTISAETQAREQSTGEESSLQTQWTAFGEAKYRHVLLSHYNASGCCVTGLAVFVVAPRQPFQYPGEAASQASRMAYELGNATAISVEESD